MCSDQIDPFWENKWTKIPKLGELILIQPIGNHNKGTKFTDESHRITSAMEHFLDSIVPDSIQYGRFDIKLDSWSDLETGKNLKIIEFNGNIAEPVSYLDPKFGYIGIQRVLFKHYYWQYKLGKKMVELGTPTPDYITGCKRLLQGKKFKKVIKKYKD